MNFLFKNPLEGLSIQCFCLAGLVSKLRALRKHSWLLGRNLGIVCAGENLAPLGRSTHSRAGQTDLHPCRNVLRPWHRQQPAAEALTPSPLAESVPVWEARKDVISSLSRAARSVSTSDEGLHMPSFLLASRHPPQSLFSRKSVLLHLD